MDIDTYNLLNPPFEFDEDALTPRKREILAWIKTNHIELRSLDPRNSRNIRSLRVYIPLELSRPNMVGPFHALRPSLSAPLLELFDDKFKLEYVESYPSADKYWVVAFYK